MSNILLNKQECEHLLRQYNVVPVAKQFPMNFDTSLSVFLKLQGDYLLESAESGDAIGRFSFIGKGALRTFVLHQSSIEVYAYNEDTPSECHTMDNPLAYVQEVMNSYSPPKDEIYQLPPFWGGVIGYLGYETIGYFESIESLFAKPGLDVPEGILLIPKQLCILDHLKRKIWIVESIHNIDEYDQADMSITESWNSLQKSLDESVYVYNTYLLPTAKDDTIPRLDWSTDISKDEYVEKIQYCKECINRGDIIQVVFSRQVHTAFPKEQELALYMYLRNVNPSPYMYYLKFDNFSIVGSSPEKMVSLTLDRTIELRPIAGTIRRGNSLDEDLALKQELLHNEKEKAEHIMLVDLGRNDLHRIARTNTVEVVKYMSVEGYSHVYHIVSKIEGKLMDDKDAFDLIQATFPAGTLSGAPKIEAMNIIGRTEPISRKVYGGMILALGFNGYMDSCITIRTALLKDGKVYLQAGGGIVADSEIELEWQETELKLGALKQAVEAVLHRSGGNHE